MHRAFVLDQLAQPVAGEVAQYSRVSWPAAGLPKGFPVARMQIIGAPSVSSAMIREKTMVSWNS